MEHDQEIAAVLARIERAKEAKTKSEVTLELLQKQREEILAELEGLGVAPEDLESEIHRLEGEVAALLAEIRDLLPEE